MHLDNDQISPSALDLTGQIVDLALLGGRKCAKRIISWCRKRLHLDGDTICPRSDDDVEFTPTDLDISIENLQAVPGKKVAGEILAKPAKLARV
ncbi:MAG: hypothetical protein OEY98_05490 [Acidimicrobiia bacterium]|nr:hypothetical protein [Acidimicrobiia bacterium]